MIVSCREHSTQNFKTSTLLGVKISISQKKQPCWDCGPPGSLRMTLARCTTRFAGLDPSRRMPDPTALVTSFLPTQTPMRTCLPRAYTHLQAAALPLLCSSNAQPQAQRNCHEDTLPVPRAKFPGLPLLCSVRPSVTLRISQFHFKSLQKVKMAARRSAQLPVALPAAASLPFPAPAGRGSLNMGCSPPQLIPPLLRPNRPGPSPLARPGQASFQDHSSSLLSTRI